MAAPVVGLAPVMNREIRTVAQSKRIRVTEFFQDYDKLRSGYVTTPQFFRCLWQTLNFKMSPEEEQSMIEKYDNKKNGTMNYRQFCEDINLNFKPDDFRYDPVTQKVEAAEYLGTLRTVRPLPHSSEEKLVNLLKHMQQFYRVNGINFRTTYEDFDKHHIGVITETQFYRNFPGPADVKDEEIKLLVNKYMDPYKPGYINYLNLHHDILAVGDFVATEKEMPSIRQTQVDHVPLILAPDPCVNALLEKLRIAVFKNGIRSLEFFRDYDKLRSGTIADNQFIAALVLAVGKQAQLSRDEIQKLLEFYRVSEGRVRYKELCDMLENTFTVPNLEKKPTEEVFRPCRGTLFRGLTPMSAEKEDRLEIVLTELRNKCKRDRILMYPYFKDFDRSQAYTRVVTPLQFGRILHFLGMNVAPQDFLLLLEKFKDPTSGDVNYPAFVETVDEQYVAHTTVDNTVKVPHPVGKPIPEVVVSFEELMARIRHIVLTLRLRVIDYFQDFDPLRSGCMSKSRFRRCLDKMRLSRIDQHDLTDTQFEVLCRGYRNPANEDEILYSKFVDDVESVFTQQGLEKTPTAVVPPQETFRVPKPGTVDWQDANQNHKDLYESAMQRLRGRVENRGILLRPFMKSFDKHNNGHVTHLKFQQALTMLDIPITEPEMAAIEARFANDVGIDYIKFLQELQPEDPTEYMYVKRLQEVRDTNAKKVMPELHAVGDLENVLLKVKTKVSKDRVRVEDFFRDYDKLRSGRINKVTFRRAMDLAGLKLYESELAFLEDKYMSNNDPEFVDYKRFCDEVESIFTTKHLEKTPLEEVVPFKPPIEWELNTVPSEYNEVFTKAMTKLKEKVRMHRMQLYPPFEDYDRVHIGSVTRSQFCRVLSKLQLESMLSYLEMQLIYQRFQANVGGRLDVNYLAFCEMIYQLAGFEWRKP